MHLKDIIKTNPQVKDYFKFGFVRNPYDRLVSAYYDFKNDKGHRSWASPIYQYERFRDFVLDLNEGPCREFIHLHSQYDFLEHGGDIGVDFVGRFENLLEDFSRVVSHIGLNSRRLVHARNGHRQNSWELEYDEEMKEIVYDFYIKDFQHFGYSK